MTRRQKEISQGEWALGDGYRERSTHTLASFGRRVSHASGGLLGHHDGLRCHTSCHSWFAENGFVRALYDVHEWRRGRD